MSDSRSPAGMTAGKAKATATALTQRSRSERSFAKGVVAERAMVVAGVMSGTSADGVDVAVCRVSPGVAGGTPRVKVLGHRAFGYAKDVRSAVLGAMDAKSMSVADMSRLHWRLGEVYAECVATAVKDVGVKVGLVACHGQTIYHQAVAGKFLGGDVRATWQIGEASVIAERLRVPVVSDFRPADMAAGGQGAPLVPMLDFCMFRHATKNRVLLNLGGIANVTALPAGCGVGDVMAFDTGPANMVVDAVMQRLYGRGFDDGGKVAARGRVVAGVVETFLRGEYFSALPPKSCGREEFGAGFVSQFVDACGDARKQDVLATATAFTAASVRDAYARFVWPHLGMKAPLARATEMFVAGGGARNDALMQMLVSEFGALGVRVAPMESVGIAAEAKEAAAFALLGWLTWFGMAGNVVSATGAEREVVLGKVTLG